MNPLFINYDVLLSRGAQFIGFTRVERFINILRCD